VTNDRDYNIKQSRRGGGAEGRRSGGAAEEQRSRGAEEQRGRGAETSSILSICDSDSSGFFSKGFFGPVEPGPKGIAPPMREPHDRGVPLRSGGSLARGEHFLRTPGAVPSQDPPRQGQED